MKLYTSNQQTEELEPWWANMYAYLEVQYASALGNPFRTPTRLQDQLWQELLNQELSKYGATIYDPGATPGFIIEIEEADSIALMLRWS
jgi:hypothetical protein